MDPACSPCTGNSCDNHAISGKTSPKDESANLCQLAIEIMYCKYLSCKVQARSSPRAARRSGHQRAPLRV